MGDPQVKKLLLSFIFGLLSLSSLADTVPATPDGGKHLWTSANNSFSGTKTWQEVIVFAAGGRQVHSTSPSSEPTWTNNSTSQVSLQVIFTSGLPGSVTVGINSAQPRYTCPTGQNWTLQGSLCTRPDCQAGETRNPATGICELPACPSGYDRNAQGQCVKNCTGKMGQPTVNGTYHFEGAVSEWAVGGCKVKCPVRVLAAGGGSGEECKFTGASASPDQPEAQARPKPSTDIPPEKPLDCLAQGKGYVQSSSGTVSCVSAGDAPPGQKPVIEKDDSKTKQGLDSNGNPIPGTESSENRSARNNGDGTITEDKQNESAPGTDANGNPTCPAGSQLVDGKCKSGSRETKTVSEYCADNPTSEVCRGTEESDACKANPDRAGCQELGSYDGAGDSLQTKAVGLSAISPLSLGGSGSCPADVTLPKGMGTWSFEKYCWFAESIRPLVLLLGWLIGGFIVFGFRGGSA